MRQIKCLWILAIMFQNVKSEKYVQGPWKGFSIVCWAYWDKASCITLLWYNDASIFHLLFLSHPFFFLCLCLCVLVWLSSQSQKSCSVVQGSAMWLLFALLVVKAGCRQPWRLLMHLDTSSKTRASLHSLHFMWKWEFTTTKEKVLLGLWPLSTQQKRVKPTYQLPFMV